MQAVRYLVDTLLWLLTLAFLLRLLLQWVRADFRDPIADAVVRVTNWLVLPLRRVLPPVARIDTATVVATLAIATARAGVLLAMAGVQPIPWGALAEIVVRDLTETVLRVYLFALLLYALSSLLAPGGYAPGTRILGQLCEPVLRPVRRIIPPIGRIDFSVLWVSILIGALLVLVR